MTSSAQQAFMNGFATTHSTSASASALPIDTYRKLFDEHRHRIYSLAFWMTDNEVTAEEISSAVFSRTFAKVGASADSLDANLVSTLREMMPIGVLTLQNPVSNSKSIVGNTKRIHLERAVVQVPATERIAFLLHDVDGYDHGRIACTLGISEDESRNAVCQARILIRELIAEMI